MPRYFLELAYKGSAYSGFQTQENARTIQSEVGRALEILFRRSFGLTGSSRTDAGVHARQNFFHFDGDVEISNRHIYNLNALLPHDIVTKGIYEVPATAHCRFDAESREYKYLIYSKKDPFLADRGWMFPYPVNLEPMQAAASLLIEYQDFTSFSKRNTQVKTHLCSIQLSAWGYEGSSLVYTVRANRFLRGMVRGLVGTMLKVGRGQMSLEEFRQVIERKDSSRADFSSPAQGLFLMAVNFPEDIARLLR